MGFGYIIELKKLNIMVYSTQKRQISSYLVLALRGRFNVIAVGRLDF